MTDRVYPSKNSDAPARYVAAAIELGGGSDEGWIIPSGDDPHNLALAESNISEGNLNAFAETSSSSSFDVTIDAGAAFVGGAWLARDTSTTVTLDSSTDDQAVYVGFDSESKHSIRVGKLGDFAGRDPRTKIWTFDTDGSGVTSATDERNLDDYRIRDADLSSNVVTEGRLTHEFGTVSGDSMASTSTQTVSFNNTYVPGTVQVSIEQDLSDSATLVTAVWDGWQTDGDGNYTGADIRYQIADDSGTINWTAQGTKI